MKSHVLAAVDIGTTKVCAVAAEQTAGGPRLIGTGKAVSRGIKKGVVINIEEAASAISSAVSEAEASTGIRIRSALVSVSGGHVSGFTSTGLIGINSTEVTEQEKLLAIESAKTVYIPLDYEVLHAIPAEFIIDGLEGITDPLGMSGVRLESRVHIITAHSRALHNLQKACELAGLEAEEIVFAPLAAAEAVLTPEETEKGAVLLDIGGGTTDIAYFSDGVLKNTSVLGIGGLHLTNDIAVGLRAGIYEAEHLKKSAGAASVNDTDKDDLLDAAAPGESPLRISRGLLAEIIRPRCEELFELAARKMAAFAGGYNPACSVVLTGGTALLPGLPGLASSVLRMPVRIGLPHGMLSLNSGIRHAPDFSAGIGLIKYAAKKQEQAEVHASSAIRVMTRIREGLRRFFEYKDFLEINRKKKGVSYV